MKKVMMTLAAATALAFSAVSAQAATIHFGSGNAQVKQGNNGLHLGQRKVHRNRGLHLGQRKAHRNRGLHRGRG